MSFVVLLETGQLSCGGLGGGDFSLQILTGMFSSLHTCHEPCTGKTLKVTGVLCAHHRAAFVVWVHYLV